MLHFLVLLPLLTSILVLPLGQKSRTFCIFATTIIFCISVAALFGLSVGADTQNLAQGMHQINIIYSGKFLELAIDKLSLLFVTLTAFLTLICVLISKEKPSGYFSLFMLLEFAVICVFCTTDLLTFYIFFEFSLVPLFFIIGIWGGKDRIYSAYKFFLYTLAGSVAFLVAILFIYTNLNTLKISDLVTSLSFIDLKTQKLLWLAFFIAFAVKLPMFPFHTWLPDAHVQAPTAGSVMLAGILIKLGGYGFLKILIPTLPEASHYFAPLVLTLSAISVIYASFIAIMQTNVKKLIAYSSVAHMGIVTAGLFSFEFEGVKGAVFQMISHGLISSALFLCVGFLYYRTNTLKINFYQGLANNMPIFAFLFIAFSVASIGLPGTSGFVGEFLSMVGLFKNHQVFSILCTTGVILGACYMLFLCKQIIWGTQKNQTKDLLAYEYVPLFSIFALVVFFGLFPSVILNLIR